MDMLLAKSLSTELLERFSEQSVVSSELSGSQSVTEGLSGLERERDRERRQTTALLGHETLLWPVFAAFDGPMVQYTCVSRGRQGRDKAWVAGSFQFL